MTPATLTGLLTALVQQALSTSPQSDQSTVTAHRSSLLPRAVEIANDLVGQAVASGLPLTHYEIEDQSLGGGNTAEIVALITLHAPFAFKLDSGSEKLAREGEMMRQIKRDSRLTQRFRDAWPIVYAIRDKAPYAYIMEYFPARDGWVSFENRLFPPLGSNALPEADASRLIHVVLDVMFDGFKSTLNTRSIPSIFEDYIKRIRERLEAAADVDERFRSQSLMVNGEVFKGWTAYLDLIERNLNFLNEITPPFSTITHGDPNPGNLILKTSVTGVDLKMIDPKDWFTGDYMFDVTKITHFVEATGPIEKPAEGPAKPVTYGVLDGMPSISYEYERPDSTRAIVQACLSRAEDFAGSHGDLHWRARYDLGMAANILGLPIGRLISKKNPRPDAALALYAEGIKWLKLFCDRLPTSSES